MAPLPFHFKHFRVCTNRSGGCDSTNKLNTKLTNRQNNSCSPQCSWKLAWLQGCSPLYELVRVGTLYAQGHSTPCISDHPIRIQHQIGRELSDTTLLGDSNRQVSLAWSVDSNHRMLHKRRFPNCQGHYLPSWPTRITRRTGHQFHTCLPSRGLDMGIEGWAGARGESPGRVESSYVLNVRGHFPLWLKLKTGRTGRRQRTSTSTRGLRRSLYRSSADTRELLGQAESSYVYVNLEGVPCYSQ